jgi:uncharacterized membrane protein YfcA
MEIAGFIASLGVGVTLGLIGSGGSILTLPILVYLFNVDVVQATGYSLFIVGATSAIGAIAYFAKGLVNVRTALLFGAPSVIAVFLTRAYLVPALPSALFSVGSLLVTKDLFLLVLFAVLMIATSFSMIRQTRTRVRAQETDEVEPSHTHHYALILAEGAMVGVFTGLVGAGGGFLIIPALVLLGNMPIKEAVGTSLVIIAAKSLIGFLGEGSSVPVDWPLLLIVTVIASAGILIGFLLARKVSGEKLKPAFGWFVLLLGVYILIKEIFLH